MSFFKRAVAPRNVSEGDLAEFTTGPNTGRRCIVEEKCPMSEVGFAIWHIHPLQMLDAVTSAPWPDGWAAQTEHGPLHAKDRDLRRVPPEELDKADPRETAAPKDEVVDAKIPVLVE